ncbi:MAG: mycofactocin biosynthesis glycosyltransferase MftF [Desulfomonilaceae bacterium]
MEGYIDRPKIGTTSVRSGTRTYKLTTSVRLVQRQPHCFLLRNYPLKAVRLGAGLAPVFRQLEESGSQSAENLVKLTPSLDETSLDHLLYRFEKMGFLESNGAEVHEPLATVSVVIPVRNRAAEIKLCLESLLKVEYPKEKLQIVVVDDASEDETIDVVNGFPVTVERMSERQGASACRNRGARQANGEILLFVDSDCVVDPRWLLEITSVFGDPQVGAAGGLVDSFDDAEPLDRYEKVKSSLQVEIRCNDSTLGSKFFYIPSCNFAVRRDLFSKVGGFNEALEVGEDVDLCWRIIDTNSSIEFRPSARVLHRHRNRLKAFCVRRFEYGTSEPLLQALHPERRKTFALMPAAVCFWFLLSASLFAEPVVIIAAAMTAVVDAVTRRRRAGDLGIPIPLIQVLVVVFRSYLSFMYQVCSFVSRYYLIVAALLAPAFPVAAAAICLAHVGVGTVEFSSRKPRINILYFWGIFSLEQLSYQSGVWFGCFREKSFSPVFPGLSVKGKYQKTFSPNSLQ